MNSERRADISKVILATVIIGGAFWAVDSYVDVYVFRNGKLLRQLIQPGLPELWIRSVVIAITLVFALTYTREKQIERDLEFKSLLLDNATDSVFVRDLNGQIVYVNEVACITRGYTKGELMAMTFAGLDVPEYAQMTKPRIEYLKKVGSAVFESAHFRKDGTIMPVEINARIVTLRGKKLIVSIVRDITVRKEFEVKLQRAKELSDALNEINTLINSTLDFDRIMQQVVVEATKAIGAETAGIDLRDGDRWVLRYVYGLPWELVGTRFTNREFMTSVLAAKSKSLVVINDALNDERVNHEVVERFNIRSMLVVPLMVREHAIGTIVFHYHSETVPFDEAQIDFASKLGTSISLAIENAHLFASQHTIADTLQEALLANPQDIPGIDFGYLYRSATEATKVGGDFYDLFELEDGKVGVLIGDVSGKGLDAATLTSVVKDTVKAYAYDDSSPASIMAKTNEIVNRCTGTATFVTLFFGILDTGSGKLTYCSAGHPPAILRKKTSEISLLFTSSPAVGAFSGLSYIDDTITIEIGDILVLYTDGVIEAKSSGEFFGEERLVELVGSFEPHQIKELPQIIFSEVASFSIGNLSDDIALLTISLDNSRALSA